MHRRTTQQQQSTQRCGAHPPPSSATRRRRLPVRIPASKEPTAATATATLPDGRQPFFNVFKQLTRPAEYFRDVLRRRDAAVGQFSVFKDTAFIGSERVARELLGAEERSGIQIGWPAALVKLIGPRSVSMVPDHEEHARQRALLLPFFSPEAVAAKMPGVQATVGGGGGRWGWAAVGVGCGGGWWGFSCSWVD